ncbi:hypothetical protein GCM10010390_20670 [Streptomyces mordarskii]|uniref:Uncharacterized protein n=1 Tax=Streptomyces mordarskii TaxID=1226758 RepID=A0ABP3MDK2_9ACTN
MLAVIPASGVHEQAAWDSRTAIATPHRLEANVQPDSTSPLNLKRLGFQREGCSTAFRFINGEWSDHERWAITAEMAQAEAPWPKIS